MRERKESKRKKKKRMVLWNRWLREQKGSGYPLAMVLVLFSFFLFLTLLEYVRLLNITQGIRNHLQDALLVTVTENYGETYHGVREGYSGAYVPVAGTFEASVDYGDVYEELEIVLGIRYNGDSYQKIKNDGTMEYQLSDLYVEIENVPFQGHGALEQFQIHGYVTVEIPFSFAGEVLPPLVLGLKTSGGYVTKF